jgi:hypothetical protein
MSALRFGAHVLEANTSQLKDSFQEQVHRLRCEQLPINCGRNRIELADVIGPGELNLKSSSSAIVANAADLNITHGLACDVQRFGAVDTIANPFPAAGAPVKVGIEMARHHAGSMRVFSKMSRRQFGHFCRRSPRQSRKQNPPPLACLLAITSGYGQLLLARSIPCSHFAYLGSSIKN